MKGLLFLSRVAFICNVLFVICLLLQRTHDFLISGDLKSTVAILGWMLAPLLTVIAVLGYGIRALQKKPSGVPGWLVIANVVFLSVEIIFHI